MKTKTQKIVFAALIGAIYAAVTVLLAPFSYGLFQVRVSEALTVLPFFSGFSVWGLFIGCIVANLFSPVGILDIVFGSAATLISAIITYFIGKSNLKFKKYLAPLPAVIVNAVVIGILVNITLIKDPVSAVIKGIKFNTAALWGSMLWIGLGELAACYVIGLPLLLAIDKSKVLKKYFK